MRLVPQCGLFHDYCLWLRKRNGRKQYEAPHFVMYPREAGMTPEAFTALAQAGANWLPCQQQAAAEPQDVVVGGGSGDNEDNGDEQPWAPTDLR